MAYHAVSPDEFDRLWQSLLQAYPATTQYLSKELYLSRKKWAWAWISTTFTAGVRTNGCIESENRVNKTLGGPKQTLLGLFNNLNERTDGKTAKEMTQVWMVSYYDTHLLCARTVTDRVHETSHLEHSTTPTLRVFSDMYSKFFGSMQGRMHFRSAGNGCKSQFSTKLKWFSYLMGFALGYVILDIIIGDLTYRTVCRMNMWLGYHQRWDLHGLAAKKW